MTPPRASFADRLRVSRMLADLTQAELAAASPRCGGRIGAVCLRTLGEYELGFGAPRCVEVGHLGCALGLHPGWLAFGEDLPCPPWLWDASAEGVAYRLRVSRIDAELSQGELAAAAGMAQAEISNIERGAQQPKIAVVSALAAALRVRPSWLAFWAGPHKKEV